METPSNNNITNNYMLSYYRSKFCKMEKIISKHAKISENLWYLFDQKMEHYSSNQWWQSFTPIMYNYFH